MGAMPVPGPTMMIGTDVSAGSLKLDGRTSHRKTWPTVARAR
jgi:hypothetical protein